MAHRKSQFSSSNSFVLEQSQPRVMSNSPTRALNKQIININGKPLQNLRRKSSSFKIPPTLEPQSPSYRNMASDTFKQILEAQNRTDDEAYVIYERIKDFKFFGQFLKEKSDDKNLDVFLFICKKFAYEAHPPGTVIMNQGDFSNGKVYIILSGELLVYVQGIAPPPPPVTQPTTTLQTPRASPLKLESVIAEQSPNAEGATPNNSTKVQQKPEIQTSLFKLTDTPRNVTTNTSTVDISKPILGTIEEGMKTQRESVMSHDDGERQQHTPKIKGFSHLASQKFDFSRKQSLMSPMFFEPKKPPVFDKQSTGNTTDIDHAANESSRQLKKSGLTLENIEQPTPGVSSYGVLVNRIHEGSYFGEKALYKKHKRNATIMTSNYVELLTLNQEDFMKVQGEFNKARAIMKQFLRSIFPKIESVPTQNVLETLLYNCEVKTFPYKKVITEEGVLGEEFFVIFEGQCEFSKAIIYDSSEKLDYPMSDMRPLYGLTRTKKESLVITNTERGTFVGEEILFNEKEVYEYTVKVASEKVRLISFKKAKFTFRCPKLILMGLQSLYNTKKHRNLLHFQEKVQRKNGPNPSPISNIGHLYEGEKPIITLHREQNTNTNNNIQNQHPTTPNYLGSPRKIMDSFRFSPKFDDTLNQDGTISHDIPTAGCPAIRSYGASPRNSYSLQKSQSDGLPGLYHFTQDGFAHEKKHTESEHLTRPTTEPGNNVFFNSANFFQNQKNFMKGYNQTSPRENSIKGQGYFSGDKVDTILGVELPEYSRNTKINSFREGFYSKQSNFDLPQEHERLFEETSKEKQARSVRSRRGLSANGTQARLEPASDRSANRAAVPNFIQFIKMKQESITKKKQKQDRRFSKNSIEISCRTSEPASIISFGTPQHVSPATSRVFVNQNRKIQDRVTSEFEKNLLNMKTRQKKPPKKNGLSEVFKIDTGIKPTRPLSTRTSLVLDMNLQFLSGLK